VTSARRNDECGHCRVMQKTGSPCREAHFLGAKMAALAEAVSEHTGFENIGVPFCMTVEAELFRQRASITARWACEPKISVRGIHVADQGGDYCKRSTWRTRNGGGRSGDRLSRSVPTFPWWQP